MRDYKEKEKQSRRIYRKFSIASQETDKVLLKFESLPNVLTLFYFLRTCQESIYILNDCKGGIG